MNTKILALAIAAAVVAPVHLAHAEAGDWEVKLGAYSINPNSDDITVGTDTFNVDVENRARPALGLGYWMGDHWQVDLFAAMPARHDVDFDGAHVARLTHLPSALTFQYHFAPDGQFDPFLGLGVNYTSLHNEAFVGSLNTSELELDNSFGLTAQIGLAFHLTDQWSIGADVRWFDVDADVEVDGAEQGSLNIDPVVAGIFTTYRF